VFAISPHTTDVSHSQEIGARDEEGEDINIISLFCPKRSDNQVIIIGAHAALRAVAKR
jgi:hypothetical protein